MAAGGSASWTAMPSIDVPAAARNPRESGQAVVAHLNGCGVRAEMVPIAPMLKGVDYKAEARNPATVAKLGQAYADVETELLDKYETWAEVAATR